MIASLKIMKCAFCAGTLGDKMVTFAYAEEDKYFFVEHVPALVCNKCGERIYSPEVTDKLLKFAKDEFMPVKTIEVPVFDFAERA